MEKLFEYVVLSTTNHPDYIGYWPLVAYAWRKLFDVTPVLAFVHHKKDEHLTTDLAKYGMVIPLEAETGIPIANQGKVSRLYVASQMEKNICVINDIDLIPLQNRYLNAMLARRPAGYVMCVGGDVYRGTPDDGKFPMGYLTAEGSTFREIVNPNGLSFKDFVRSFIGMRVYDHKEDITITLPPGHTHTFSDESLFRVFLRRWNQNHRTLNFTRGWEEYHEKAACRAAWNLIDFDKLDRGEYVECHAPHPFNEDAIRPFMDYLKRL